MTPAQRAAYDRRAATLATRRAALAEDICWLRDTGEHPERAAQRLGLTLDALAKSIQRLGIAWPAAVTAQRRLHRRTALSSCPPPTATLAATAEPPGSREMPSERRAGRRPDA